jgi:hypothetical protein
LGSSSSRRSPSGYNEAGLPEDWLFARSKTVTHPTSRPTPKAPAIPQLPQAGDEGPFMTEEEILSLIHPRIREALATFERDLPQLLQDRYGQWVAYHGVNRLGFGNDKTELYQRLRDQGYDDRELLVTYVEPQGTVEYL